MTDSQDHEPSLLRLELTFFADGSTDKWLKFAKKIGAKVRVDADDAGFAALPDDLGAKSLYVVGGFHPSAKNAKKSTSVHWHLAWISPPDGDPPDTLKKRSAKVGGYPLVMANMRKHWVGGHAPDGVNIDFTAIWELGQLAESDKLAPPPAQTLTIGGSTVIEKHQSRSWTIEPPLGGIRSIRFVQIQGKRQVHISGECRTSIDPTLPEKLEASVWGTMNLLTK